MFPSAFRATASWIVDSGASNDRFAWVIASVVLAGSAAPQCDNIAHALQYCEPVGRVFSRSQSERKEALAFCSNSQALPVHLCKHGLTAIPGQA